MSDKSTQNSVQTTNKISKPQLFLGPSQFASALGLSKFKDPETLQQELEDGSPFVTTPKTIFGNKQEALAMYCYRKRTGFKVIKARRKKKYAKNIRIGGKCDGIVVDQLDRRWRLGLLEIKCHHDRTTPYEHIPTYHLVQVAGYLAIYNVPWCDFMSCCFNDKGELTTYKIFRIEWEDVKDPWEKTWYPHLLEFLDKVDWRRPKHLLSKSTNKKEN